MKVKVLSLLLCLAMLLTALSVFSACTPKKGEEVDENMTVVIKDGITSYKLIRAERANSSVTKIAMDLRATIIEKCGCEIDLNSDWVKDVEEIDPNAYEILIGNTNRPESAEVMATLEPNSWAIVNKGNKIVICANNDSLLSVAVNWFVDNCINEEEKTLKVENNLSKNDGFGDSVLVSVNGITSFQIVYPKGNQTLEYYASLAQRNTMVNGGKLPVVTDDKAQSEYEIVIGDTSRAAAPTFTGNYEYSIKTEGTKIYINASDEETLYYALNYYLEYGIKVSEGVVSAEKDFNKTAALSNFFLSKWKLNIPYIESGTIAKAYNLGPGLVDDRNGDTITDSHMHLVYNVEYSDFEKYATKLESFGYKKAYTSKTENNDLWGFRLGESYAYVHYSPNEKYIRVIWDKSSNCEVADFEYVAEQTGTTTFYQYSIDLAGCELVFGEASGWGMLYIIKLQDNSLILVDGGNNPSWNDRSMKGLTDFLYDITDTDKKTPLEIKLWYFTHPDDDHNGLTQPWINYLKQHGYKAPNIGTVAFNYPSERANEGYHKYGTAFQMINYINANYPDVNYLKLHTGMVFNIGEVSVEVLGTVENMVGRDGNIPAGFDTNDTCSIVRFGIAGTTFFMCGDTGNHREAPDYHMALYSRNYLKSDVNQIAHHGLNVLGNLNKFVGAKYALVSYSYEGLKDSNHSYFLTLVDVKNLYYAGNFHTAFEFNNGQMTVKKITRYDHPTGVLENPDIL